MRRNCRNFKEWCISQYEEFCRVMAKSVALKCRIETGGKNSICAFVYNTKTAWCVGEKVNATKFNNPTKVALGLAWASYKCEPIPDFFTTILIKDLPNGAEFYANERGFIEIGPDPRNSRIVAAPLDASSTYQSFHPLAEVVYKPH